MRQLHQTFLAGWHASSVRALNHIRVNQEVNQDDKSAAKTRLLIVDDEPAVCRALQRVLRMEGFEVVCALTCHEAMELLYERHVGLMLLDINVAHENGWDLCRRALANFPDLLVVAITAKPDQEVEAMESGAHALMEKPLDLPRLLKTINKLVAGKSTICPLQKSTNPEPLVLKTAAAGSLAEVK